MTFAALSEYVAGNSVALVGGNRATIEPNAIRYCDVTCGVHLHADAFEPRIVVAGFEVPDLQKAEHCIVNMAWNDGEDVIPLCEHYEVAVTRYDSNTYKDENPRGPEFEWHNAFSKELNALPFTGISAMKLLLMMPIAELFVTGFTFYANDEGEFPYRVNAHFIEPQVEWFRRTVETDARVTLDSTLKLLFPERVKVRPDLVQCRTDENGYLWRI